ncbi:hypothetical protein SAMN05216202_1527 [Pseudomonas mucidolens]|uniref:Uncharacterized protein n=1 Tax=Pseudomonas mucidolens TaxID=46679 RepID=A0A1H2MEP2_9PSED|nr:hypothetical protein SAMN05216202_1527 [Pseudomonas mucidolens]SQH34056.1 Uncharacterised protein [Pseudomonas mucidolens]
MRPVMTMAPKWEANKKVGNKDLREARFHQWGCEYEEFESGPGNYTVAVVEFADGSIGTVMPECKCRAACGSRIGSGGISGCIAHCLKLPVRS